MVHALLSNPAWVPGPSKNSFVINWRSNCGRRAWQLLPSPRSRTIADFATTSGPRLGRRHQTSRKGSGVGFPAWLESAAPVTSTSARCTRSMKCGFLRFRLRLAACIRGRVRVHVQCQRELCRRSAAAARTKASAPNQFRIPHSKPQPATPIPKPILAGRAAPLGVRGKIAGAA